MQTKQNSHATHIWLHYLPCHQKFCFGLNRHYIFVRSLLYIFEFEYVWTCFFSMLHSFVISPSQCAPKGSAGQSTYIFSVTWLVHNLLIALPALPPTILFWFEQKIAFLPVHLFYIHFWVWICLFFYMFHPFTFSHPKGSAEQSTNTFLVARLAHNFLIVLPALSTQILFWFSQTIALLPIYSFYIFESEYVWMFCSYVSFICNFPS